MVPKPEEWWLRSTSARPNCNYNTQSCKFFSTTFRVKYGLHLTNSINHNIFCACLPAEANGAAGGGKIRRGGNTRQGEGEQE